jgi:hypothetical protein
MAQVFGLINPLPSFGFSAAGGGEAREETLAPVLDAVTAFRDSGGVVARLQAVPSFPTCALQRSCLWC